MQDESSHTEFLPKSSEGVSTSLLPLQEQLLNSEPYDPISLVDFTPGDRKQIQVNTSLSPSLCLTQACVHACVCVCLCTCMTACVCLHLCVCLCLYLCVSVSVLWCVYMYMYLFH